MRTPSPSSIISSVLTLNFLAQSRLTAALQKKEVAKTDFLDYERESAGRVETYKTGASGTMDVKELNDARKVRILSFFMWLF